MAHKVICDRFLKSQFWGFLAQGQWANKYCHFHNLTKLSLQFPLILFGLFLATVGTCNLMINSVLPNNSETALLGTFQLPGLAVFTPAIVNGIICAVGALSCLVMSLHNFPQAILVGDTQLSWMAWILGVVMQAVVLCILYALAAITELVMSVHNFQQALLLVATPAVVNGILCAWAVISSLVMSLAFVLPWMTVVHGLDVGFKPVPLADNVTVPFSSHDDNFVVFGPQAKQFSSIAITCRGLMPAKPHVKYPLVVGGNRGSGNHYESTLSRWCRVDNSNEHSIAHLPAGASLMATAEPGRFVASDAALSFSGI